MRYFAYVSIIVAAGLSLYVLRRVIRNGHISTSDILAVVGILLSTGIAVLYARTDTPEVVPPPVVERFVANPETVVIGQASQLSVVARGNTLRYFWTAQVGNVPSDSGVTPRANYTAPDTPGRDRVTVTIEDKDGRTSSATIVLTIVELPAATPTAPASSTSTAVPTATTAVTPTTAVTETPEPSSLPSSDLGPNQCRVVATDGVNLRQGPGFSEPVLTTLLSGTLVFVKSRTQDAAWLSVTVGGMGTDGWVTADSGIMMCGRPVLSIDVATAIATPTPTAPPPSPTPAPTTPPVSSAPPPCRLGAGVPLSVSVEPAAVHSGSALRLSAHGLVPGEPVSIWLTSPSNQVYDALPGLAFPARADSNGHLVLTFNADPAWPSERWWAVTVSAMDRSRQGCAYFAIEP